MKVSIDILIATKSRPSHLEKNLRSIFENSQSPTTTFVIDQSEDDASRKVVDKYTENFDIRYIHKDTPGKALALNAALRESQADFIALTDDDCELSSNWFETASATLDAYPEHDAFCGQVLPEPETEPDDYLNLVVDNESKEITLKQSPLSYAFCGANLLIRRQTLIDAGSFNPLFGPGGKFYCNIDGELAYRLLLHGAKLLFQPDLIVYHSHWRGDKDNQQLRYRYAYGLGAFAGYYLRRHHFKPTYFWCRKVIAKMLKTVYFSTSGRTLHSTGEISLLKGLWQGFFAGFNTSKQDRNE